MPCCQMASLHAQPALQIRVQQALEQARGLLHKAKAKLAQAGPAKHEPLSWLTSLESIGCYGP